VIIAGTCFSNVFQEILKLCAYDFLSFTKEDVENLPPFERQSYIDIIDNMLKEQEDIRKQEQRKQKQ
jgi:hypothetical protein